MPPAPVIINLPSDNACYVSPTGNESVEITCRSCHRTAMTSLDHDTSK